MRELVYFVAVSLDGKISGPGDDFSAFPVEGDHIDWILREYVDTVPKVGLDALGLEADGSRFATVLMGWNTYVAGLSATDNPYPHLEQVVFTRTHGADELPDGIRVVADDPVAEVQRLKKESGADIWLCGGGALAATLVDEIDRMVLKVNPFVLGAGVPLFADTSYDARAFSLVTSTAYRTGVVVNDYQRT